METKKLLICPVCLQKGSKNILGAIDGKKFTVLRKRNRQYWGVDLFGKPLIENSYQETIINGNDFSVTCGDCGNTIYIRRQDGNGHNRGVRFSWQTSIQEIKIT